MQKNVKTIFSDVLGNDEFKEEMVEIVNYMNDPQKYIQCGAKLPKGILLSGQPSNIWKFILNLKIMNFN